MEKKNNYNFKDKGLAMVKDIYIIKSNNYDYNLLYVLIVFLLYLGSSNTMPDCWN